MSHNAFDWDDLRHLLAVAEAASFAGAARRLGVNHTTVLRRIAGLEDRLGARLFDRTPAGVALTAAGEEALAAARAMAETAAEVERRVLGRDLALSGPLTIATTDTLATSVLPAHLKAFAIAHPDVEITLTTDPGFADLARRDADVAIRPAADPPESLVGRRVADIAFAAYAAPGAAEGDWIGVVPILAGTATGRWMRTALPDARIAARVDSLVAMLAAAKAGLGRAMLPCYLADGVLGLSRVEAPAPPPRSALWMLTHEDLRRTARVNAFMGEVGRGLAGEAARFEGRTA